VTTGDKPVGIGQDPVIFERATNGPAIFQEHALVIVTEDIAVVAGNFQLQGHRFARQYLIEWPVCYGPARIDILCKEPRAWRCQLVHIKQIMP
jgi:hypothetical protein